MEAKIVQFAVKNNNDIYKLEPAKTLLNFIEFDFTYFWEKCIDAGRTAKKSGRLPHDAVAAAKAVIKGMHPYIEALIGDDFSDVVVDCIIEYICHAENIDTEELWMRCISPKNLYEEAIFKRISKYKTGTAINQWSNIVKMQEYAKNKLAFIYDGDENGSVVPDEIINTRKEYFDLAYSMAANELGIDGMKLPSVRVSSSALMPNASFMNSAVSRTIYRRFAEILRLGSDMSETAVRDCSNTKDRLAMEAYSYVRGMKRPDEADMLTAIENLKNNSCEVYMPDSFKAIIDLEFDLILRYGMVLRKCENCGRYFAAEGLNVMCDRINSSGVTCRQQFGAVTAAIEEAAAVKREQRSAEVPPELEKRSREIYDTMSSRVGRTMDEKEFSEWSRYLSDMERNIKSGEATIDQLSDFLDYSDTLASSDLSAQKSYTPYVPASFDDEPPAKKAPELIRVVPAKKAEVKAFQPQAFDSVFDAFMAEHTKDGKNDAAPEKPAKAPVEIKPFQWKRMTREEAYGLKED